MLCEMCGTEKGPFYDATVEGSKMTICTNCARYASDKQPVKTPQEEAPRKAKTTTQQAREERRELLQIITPNYAKLIKEARERKGLKQEELAKRIAEKESLLHALESGKHEPSLSLARKLEKHLGLTLVVQHEEKHQGNAGKWAGPVTIADILKQ